MNSKQVREVLEAFGIPETKNIAGCSVCEESNGIDLKGLETDDKKYFNIFLCIDCETITFQEMDNPADDFKREIEILEEKRDNCTINDDEEKRLTYLIWKYTN